MKTRTIVLACVLFAMIAAVEFELGLFQRAFDERSIIADGVVGSDFWIMKVDDRPVDRIPHGFVITKVPLALVEPGVHVLELSNSLHSNDPKTTTLRVHVEKGVNYRITTTSEGKPELIAKR